MSTKRRTIACYTGLMMSLRLRERHDNSVDIVMRILLPKWRKFKNISARNFRTAAGAKIICLVAESAHSIDGRGCNCCSRLSAKHARRRFNSRAGHERSRNSSTVSSCCSHEGGCDRLDCMHTKLFVMLKGSDTTEDW